MNRSHLSARHLLRQIESDRSKRVNRDIRPEWLIRLIEYVAELFEPLADVGWGRVGFDCRPGEARDGGGGTGGGGGDEDWTVALYLGAIEHVGGKVDGLAELADFRIDLQPLLERFSRVDHLSWTVVTRKESDDSTPRSLLSVGGLIGESRVRLTIQSSPPDGVSPGLRKLEDGRIEPI